MASRLLICIGYTLRLWSLGFASGAVVGYAVGVALGWSKRFSYWGMPILKLIGPVPATAWIPCTFYFFPTTFAASVFIVALSAGIPVAILTSSGVASVNRAYYDVGRNLGASEWYLVSKIAVPASLPHAFVGLFMGLYYSFAVLVVAEMLGAKFGPGLVHPVPDRLFGLRQRLCDARHHVPHLRRHRQASVRRARPPARLAKGIHLMAATATALRAAPAAARNVAIDIRGVSHAFDLDGSRLPVLESIDLTVAAGEFVALLGPSGCGKSTLLRLVSGLEQPTSGSISADGSLIDRPDPSRILVFQDPTLFPWATVWKNVATGLDARGVLKQERHRVDDALDLVGLRDFGKAYPHQLSGGMAQRAALARALVNDPALLLLDEPLGKLDSLTRLTLQEELVSLWRTGRLHGDSRDARCRGGGAARFPGYRAQRAAGAHQGRIQGRTALSAPSRRSRTGRAEATDSGNAGPRDMRSRLTPALLALGARRSSAAIAWWWITFGEVVRFGYLSWPEAGGCLVQNSDICSLAKALCLGSHPRFLIAYWASVFWLGVIVLSASLLTSERARVAQ